MQPVPTASISAAAVSHDSQDGACMSQELPSFHDWGQTGTSPLRAGKVADPFTRPAALLAVTAAAASPEVDDSSARQGPQSTDLPLQSELQLSAQSALIGGLSEEAARQSEQTAEQQEEVDTAMIPSAHALGPDGAADADRDPSREHVQQGMTVTGLGVL